MTIIHIFFLSLLFCLKNEKRVKREFNNLLKWKITLHQLTLTLMSHVIFSLQRDKRLKNWEFILSENSEDIREFRKLCKTGETETLSE